MRAAEDCTAVKEGVGGEDVGKGGEGGDSCVGRMGPKQEPSATSMRGRGSALEEGGLGVRGGGARLASEEGCGAT